MGKFDTATGESGAKHKGFSEAFGHFLCQMAESDPRICAVTAAMQYGTGLNDFSRLFPKRFFDVGIAEEHAVAMSAGLAAQGMLPFAAIYSTFLQRAYDMLLHDVAISGQHVIFCVDRAA